MNTAELVKQRLPEVLKMYGLPQPSNKHIKECPVCGKKDKFRLTNYKGMGEWVCTCGAGNVFGLIEQIHGLDFKAAAKEIDEAFGNTFKAVPQKRDDSKLDQAIARVNKSTKVRESNVKEYLNARGIYDMPQRGVLCSNGNMYAIATDSFGKPVYSHETFLDGDKKAAVKTQKKMLTLVDGSPDMAVIRLFDVASTLGIAEGIETALSAHQIYKCKTWSTINSGFMKKFKAPAGVSHLIIFADNDKNGEGLAAAFACGNLNIKSVPHVKTVTIRWCGDVEDFNDMLINGSQVFEWKLTK